jgi:predicted GH43/DUF377 family glycosyl hydrolase
MKRFLIPGYTMLILLFTYCEGKDENGGDEPGYADINIPVSDAWSSFSGNPVISFGDSINNAQWNSPSVMMMDETYVMYLTANLGDFGENVVPFRAVSTNGTQWNINETPLLGKGDSPTAIDFNGIESPTVVKFNGQYHMYYTVVPQDVIGSRAIGHATSDNGIDWVKDPNNPVLKPTGETSDWNGIQVAEPGAVVFNNKIYLYFAGQAASPDSGIPANSSSIGLSMSADGFTFEQQQKVLSLGLPYLEEEGFTGYGSPSPLVYNNNMHLFYDVFFYNEDENISHVRVALHHAFSMDGINNWSEDDQAVFIRDSFDWSRREIRAPSAIINQNTIHLWFAGDDFISDNNLWGVGYGAANIDFLD